MNFENITAVVTEKYGQTALRVATGEGSYCGAVSALEDRSGPPLSRNSIRQPKPARLLECRARKPVQ